MTVTQNEAMRGYLSLMGLNKQKISSGKVAKQLYDLSQKLKGPYDFQIQEEKKILESYPDFDPHLNGIRIDGKTPEEREKIDKDLKEIDKQFKEIAELDVEIDHEPFEFDLDRFNTVEISPEDIGNLEKFIKFV
jgi:hypothetical protein